MDGQQKILTLLPDVSHNSFNLALSEDSTSVDRFLEQMSVGPSNLPQTPSMSSQQSTPQPDFGYGSSHHSTPQPEPLAIECSSQQVGMEIDPLIDYSQPAGPSQPQGPSHMQQNVAQNLVGPSYMQPIARQSHMQPSQNLAGPSHMQQPTPGQQQFTPPFQPQQYHQQHLFPMSPPTMPFLPPADQAVISVTPKKKKIERIITQRQFKKVSNAGRLAVALTTHMFGEKVMRVSSVTGDHGRHQALDEGKMSEIDKSLWQCTEIRSTT